jgi:mevalonate kinase
MSPASEGRGLAKVILLGEHAVVHGQPALAAALDVGVRVRAVRAASPRLLVPAWDVDVGPDGGSELSTVFRAILAEAAPVVREVELTVAPEVPSRAGLGSSAALAVAMVRALATLAGERPDADEIEARASRAEAIFHGRASGIDAAVACRGGVLRFVRGERPAAVACRPLPAVVAQVEPRTSTSEMVARVARALEAEPRRVGAVFEEIGGLVDEAVRRVEVDDLDSLGDLMDRNQGLLRDLGVSTPALDRACARAREAGAVGAKLTGAGGGGCMIALAPGCEDAVAAALEPLSTWVRRARLGEG